MKRDMSVSGTFYPNETDELKRYFTHFESVYDEQLNLPDIKTRAIIVPHAGYIYSGFTASIAYRLLAKSGVKKFVVIGPSHRIAFNGVSLGKYESYNTPFGELKQDEKLYTKLKEEFSLKFIQEAHAEHSTEVQFPFLKYYIDEASILELVYSDANATEISKLINYILSDEEYGVIISTDLSHFYTQDEALKLDSICLDALKHLDLNKLHSGCEACGIIGVEAMMISAKELSLEPNILDHRTSADTSNDNTRVVGYMSAYFK